MGHQAKVNLAPTTRPGTSLLQERQFSVLAEGPILVVRAERDTKLASDGDMKA